MKTVNMENQHRKIAGYRELSQTEIDLMNEVKAFGPQLQALCQKVIDHQAAQHQKATDANDQDELKRLADADPYKWAVWGKDGMQANLMYLTRAIAQPTFF